VKALTGLVLGLTVGALVTGGALIGVQQLGSRGTAAASTPEPVRTATASVERRDMRTETELEGSLGYADPGELLAGLAGTVTRLPGEGRVLEQGDRVLEVDGARRSGLLYGDKPAWRRIADGMGDGTDVLQLERALRALGHLPRSIRPDREFDIQTERAIKRWQRTLGVTRDGVLDLGEVVFLPGPVRVGALKVGLGERIGPGQVIASVTSTSRVVSIDLDAEDQGIVAVGDAVTVELPDDTRLAGTVREIGTVATAGQDGSVSVPVSVSLDDPAASGTLDGAPVTVLVVRQSRDDVLAVPVESLLALREGGYAVQVADADGSTHYVAVQLGMFTEGWVEVTGDVAEDDRVVVPA
jgi:peptidoglycan hydrolase-like protein with peptidoglycan-binding domain